MTITNYLTTLITEKGASIHDEINLPGHFGLTWETLINFVEQCPEYHNQIRTTLVKIDFQAGDVFHYLTHLAQGMVKAWGY
ncbi:MAG: hypothetical protein CML60_09850 [Rhodobacteraceae bacterium]|nr:hypothetical protein [Paracoccaceae bacterium]